MKILTPRLILRPFLLSDAGPYLSLTQDEEVHKFASYMCPSSTTECEQHIANYFSKSNFRSSFYFVIEEKQSNQMVGALLLAKSPTINSINQYDIAFFIGKDFRNKGYMTEALNALITKWPKDRTIVFDVLNLNVPAIKLVSKLPGIAQISSNKFYTQFHLKK